MATAMSWLVGTVLLFLGFGMAACSALGSRRRSRFYTRLGGASLVLLASAAGLAFAIGYSADERAFGVGWLALLLVSLAVPAVFCYERPAPSRGSSDGEGGGGPRRDRPTPPPVHPSGGTPLPDADPASVRLRDHNRSSLRDARRRRPAHEPSRRRETVSAGRHNESAA